MGLTLVHERLAASLAPVLRDVETTGARVPAFEESDWTEDPRRPAAMMWLGGSGQGVAVSLDDDESTQVLEATDRVQEFVIEDRYTRGNNWPPCPHHPDTHPLDPVVHDGSVWWACPRGGGPVAQVGRLAKGRADDGAVGSDAEDLDVAPDAGRS